MTAQGDTTMKFTPLYDRVLVKRVEEEARSAGGIIIPDSAKEKPLRGKVLAAGKGKLTDDGKLRTLAEELGDVVLFGKYAGTEIKIDGDEHTILREDDILGIVEG
jgi:chaperonin GroES